MNKKKKILKSMLVALSLSLTNPIMIRAEEKEYSKEDFLEKAKEYGKKVVNWCEDVDKKINENVVTPVTDKLSEVEIYKHESLWLIHNLEEDRYYFVDKNSLSFSGSTSYDKNGEKVKKDDYNEVKRVQKEMYISLTDYEDVFLIEYTFDLENNTNTVNYVDFDPDESSYENVRYVRFTDSSITIPLAYRKEKYSTKDLKNILDLFYNNQKDESYYLKRGQ